MREELVESFTAMAATELPRLRRFAYAVCGDHHRADDLVQAALERVFVAWPRACSAEDHGAYVRTVLSRLAISDSRRPWFRRERGVAAVPESSSPDPAPGVIDGMDLAAALEGLTRKQRAVVVLRFLEDRPVAEVADILGVGPGTVKRQSHDALTHMRKRLRVAEEPTPARGEQRRT
jgi:RNA polymerase sigma-70 factor (sigma-E family)